MVANAGITEFRPLVDCKYTNARADTLTEKIVSERGRLG